MTIPAGLHVPAVKRKKQHGLLTACLGVVTLAMSVANAQLVADLSLTSTVSDSAPVIGTPVTFQVTLENAGPQAVQQVVVRDLLPAGYTYVSHSVRRGSYNPGNGEWSGFRIAANASLVLKLVGSVNASGNHANAAEVMVSSATDPDSTPGNGNKAEDDYTRVKTTPLADLSGSNIVVIMVDDLDVRSLQDMLNAGLMSSLKKRIIDRGIELSETYVTTPFCCPSRATFLTGEYPHNTGIVNNELAYPGYGVEHAVGMFDDSTTIATRLRGLGYTTGHIGKYLNGYGSKPELAALSPAFEPHYVPPGWSYWSGLVDFSTYCVYDYTINHDGVLASYLLPPGQTENTALYQTNKLADLAEDFVMGHRDDTTPFYLEVMPLAPHIETCTDAYDGEPPDGYEMRIRPAPEDATAVVPAFVPGPAYDEDVSDKPVWLSGKPALTAADRDNIAQQYQQRLRSLLSVDRLIGRIVAALGSRIDDTILIFTSDNGWFYGDHRLGGKTFAYHESSHVPLYVALPESGSTAPVIRTNLVLNNDIAPTLLDLVAPGYADARFDGRSIAPILRQGPPPGWEERQRFLIEYARSERGANHASHPTYAALRSRNNLYVESYGGVYFEGSHDLIGLELYDLTSDPHELTSLLHYPENGRDPTLAPLLDLLKECAGMTCTQYENGPIEP
jgi:uncharacterized repeat protein (TIGR01451 family)